MANDEEKGARRETQYMVLTKCYGFTDDPGVPENFRTRLWKKGEKITLDSKVRVPRHFHDLSKPTPQQAREKKRAINSRKVRKISNPDAN